MDVQFEFYVTCDDEVDTHGILTDTEFIEVVNQNRK